MMKNIFMFSLKELECDSIFFAEFILETLILARCVLAISTIHYLFTNSFFFFSSILKLFSWENV